MPTLVSDFTDMEEVIATPKRKKEPEVVLQEETATKSVREKKPVKKAKSRPLEPVIHSRVVCAEWQIFSSSRSEERRIPGVS